MAAAWCRGLRSSDPPTSYCIQVQDLEFAQIEKKVLDGLKVGNECLKKMHEVSGATRRPGGLAVLKQSADQLFLPAGDVHRRGGADHG